MEPADSIVRLGFSRWYERQLIEAHAWLVTGLLSMVAIAACVEELAYRESAARLLAYVTLVLAAGWIGLYALRRYQQIMSHAEYLGEHATCADCGAYARFRMISANAAKCRKCANEWKLID